MVVAVANGNISLIMAMLADSDRDARRVAAVQLGKLRVREAVPRLLYCAELAGDEVLRLNAIQSLARIGSSDAASPLYAIATGANPYRVRFNAADAVATLGDTRGVCLLASFLSDDLSVHLDFPGRYASDHKKWIAKRLADLRDPGAIVGLRTALAGATARERRAYQKAIKVLESESFQ